jgi:hypothetical protein
VVGPAAGRPASKAATRRTPAAPRRDRGAREDVRNIAVDTVARRARARDRRRPLARSRHMLQRIDPSRRPRRGAATRARVFASSSSRSSRGPASTSRSIASAA